VPVIAPALDNDKFIVDPGVSLFDVNTEVVSVIVTALSDEADTDKLTLSPAPTDPKEPAAVEKLGADETVKIALVVLTAPPSLFSTLM
jgi:hypothetical protein